MESDEEKACRCTMRVTKRSVLQRESRSTVGQPDCCVLTGDNRRSTEVLVADQPRWEGGREKGRGKSCAVLSCSVQGGFVRRRFKVSGPLL